MMVGVVLFALAVFAGFTWRGALCALAGALLVAPALMADAWERANVALWSPAGSGVVELAAVVVGLCVMVGLARRRGAR